MLHKDSHLSDEELLLAADGELGVRRQAQVHRHLQHCWNCRRRMSEVESNVQEFAGAYRALLDHDIPTGEGPEAKLRWRLLNESRVASGRDWQLWGAVGACACLIALLGAAFLFHRNTDRAIPDPRLTPGEAMTASSSAVCQANTQADDPPVPVALREAVFSEYGMQDAQRSAYQVDFLITPRLGGSAGIRNLWPQPSTEHAQDGRGVRLAALRFAEFLFCSAASSRAVCAYSGPAWNARAKDALEDRLHSMVCSGDLDLPTAQREIATNWVDAYRKYVGPSQRF